MKKIIKLIIGIIIGIAICLILDLICIYMFNRPLFAIKISSPYKYSGLFYDTYYCQQYTVPQIKFKWDDFECSNNLIDTGKVVEIVDKTKEKKAFICASVLDEFYKDDDFTYYYSCAKGDQVVVRYESGFEESVGDALRKGTIKIEDLDKYDISYIKQDSSNNEDVIEE